MSTKDSKRLLREKIKVGLLSSTKGLENMCLTASLAAGKKRIVEFVQKLSEGELESYVSGEICCIY